MFRNFRPFFQAQQADIICLQEVLDSKEAVPDWIDTFQTMKVIKEASKLPNQYISPTYCFDIMGSEVDSGNGLLSRYAINNPRTVFTYGMYAKIAKPGDYVVNTRNVQIVDIHTPEGDITVANTHAHWESDPMGSELSVERIEKLIRALENIKGPLIVVGDFNLRSESDGIRLLKDKLKLKDLTEEHGILNTLNNLATTYKVACDHIFIGDHIKVNKFEMLETLLSDHKALSLDFLLN